MKAIKMIGLAALMALMAMAFVGATSAMAENTALCSADENPCAEKNEIESVHETSVGTAKLLSSVGTTECNVLFSNTETELGAPLILTGNFTYTNCELGGSSCTATEEKGPAEIEVLKEGHETAKVTGKGLVHLVCSGFIDCSYNGTGLVGTAKGPLLSTQKNGEVTLSEQSTTKEAGGFLCPKTAKLDITTTPLSTTYITKAAGMACVRRVEGLYRRRANARECELDIFTAGLWELVTNNGVMECVSQSGGLFLTNAGGGVCSNDVKLDGRFELVTL